MSWADICQADEFSSQDFIRKNLEFFKKPGITLSEYVVGTSSPCDSMSYTNARSGRKLQDLAFTMVKVKMKTGISLTHRNFEDLLFTMVIFTLENCKGKRSTSAWKLCDHISNTLAEKMSSRQLCNFTF